MFCLKIAEINVAKSSPKFEIFIKMSLDVGQIVCLKSEEKIKRKIILIYKKNVHTEKRFQRLFESVGPKIQLYQPLLERPSAISRLARICETSEMLWNHLLNHLLNHHRFILE